MNTLRTLFVVVLTIGLTACIPPHDKDKHKEKWSDGSKELETRNLENLTTFENEERTAQNKFGCFVHSKSCQFFRSDDVAAATRQVEIVLLAGKSLNDVKPDIFNETRLAQAKDRLPSWEAIAKDLQSKAAAIEKFKDTEETFKSAKEKIQSELSKLGCTAGKLGSCTVDSLEQAILIRKGKARYRDLIVERSKTFQQQSGIEHSPDARDLKVQAELATFDATRSDIYIKGQWNLLHGQSVSELVRAAMLSIWWEPEFVDGSDDEILQRRNTLKAQFSSLNAIFTALRSRFKDVAIDGIQINSRETGVYPNEAFTYSRESYKGLWIKILPTTTREQLEGLINQLPLKSDSRYVERQAKDRQVYNLLSNKPKSDREASPAQVYKLDSYYVDFLENHPLDVCLKEFEELNGLPAYIKQAVAQRGLKLTSQHVLVFGEANAASDRLLSIAFDGRNDKLRIADVKKAIDTWLDNHK